MVLPILLCTAITLLERYQIRRLTMAKKKSKITKPKINKYKCDKCGTKFNVSELDYPVCTNANCKSTATQQIT